MSITVLMLSIQNQAPLDHASWSSFKDPLALVLALIGSVVAFLGYTYNLERRSHQTRVATLSFFNDTRELFARSKDRVRGIYRFVPRRQVRSGNCFQEFA
jgi:nitrate reductase gamma subunit